jgi:quinol monooxygenase YgiN
MIILAGSIRIAPGKRDSALVEIRRMVEATRAEPGCRAYTFAFDVNDDHQVNIFEVFADAAALAAHRASAHMAHWRSRAQDIGVGERDMSEYTVSASRKI